MECNNALNIPILSYTKRQSRSWNSNSSHEAFSSNVTFCVHVLTPCLICPMHHFSKLIWHRPLWVLSFNPWLIIFPGVFHRKNLWHRDNYTLVIRRFQHAQRHTYLGRVTRVCARVCACACVCVCVRACVRVFVCGGVWDGVSGRVGYHIGCLVMWCGWKKHLTI